MSIHRKRYFFIAFTMLIASVASVLAAEISGRIVYRIAKRQSFNSGTFRHQLAIARDESSAAASEAEDYVSAEIIHPYLGFVQNQAAAKNRVDGFGFPVNMGIPVHHRNDTHCLVGIFGGSFAQGVATHHSRLSEAIERTGRTPVIVNTAMGGYKQPQQLLTLVYLLAMGGGFDVVVNIDGFNEVTLPVAENLPKHVFPLFPRNWYFRMAQRHDESVMLMLGEMQYLQRARRNWVDFADRPVLMRSICWFTLWRYRERELAHRIHGLHLGILNHRPDAQIDAMVNGPHSNTGDPDCLFPALAEHWANSSRLMHAICVAEGIDYYHFLQPNQYVEGSRELLPEEAAAAFDPDHPYRPGVMAGYPHLRRLGGELATSGVNFTDLTMAFSAIPVPVYADTCCHPDANGYEIIGGIIGDMICDDMTNGLSRGSRSFEPVSIPGGWSGNLFRMIGASEELAVPPRRSDGGALKTIKEKLSAADERRVSD